MSEPQIIPMTDQQTIEMVFEDFLSDRMARCTPRTVTNYYAPTLLVFVGWCERRGIRNLDDLTTADLRAFIAELQTSHNTGGVHGYYRAVRAFLNWYEDEYGLSQNPARRWRVRTPASTPMPGVTIETVMQLAHGASVRDRVIILILLETGLRAMEFIALNIDDYEPREGAVHIRHGKGDRSRTVYLGNQTRLLLMRYLRTRDYTGDDPLFVTVDGTRLTFWGLRQVVRRNAERVGIPCPGLHDFRRCCALNLIRNGMSLAHVSLWLGHQSVGVTMRYLNLGNEDLRQAQVKASPVDRWYKKPG